MTVRRFISALADVQMPNVFNPYAEQCAEHDRLDAAACRRANLETFLNAAIAQRVDTIWIARDLGYRGDVERAFRSRMRCILNRCHVFSGGWR